jgi:hypothetical protein
MGPGIAGLVGSVSIALRSWRVDRKRMQRQEERRPRHAEALRGWEEMEAETRAGLLIYPTEHGKR